MSNREEIRNRLTDEYRLFTTRLADLEREVDASTGSIRLYRMRRLERAQETKDRINARLKLLSHSKGDARDFEVERLWSDVKNAVLGM
jgi:hypothetical protein